MGNLIIDLTRKELIEECECMCISYDKNATKEELMELALGYWGSSIEHEKSLQKKQLNETKT